MTLLEIEEHARRRYNAVGDTNWSSAEINQLVYEASLEITRDCGIVIEKLFQSSSVVATATYAFPTEASSIKRITFGGRKLKEITMAQDDIITLENQLSTDSGTPQFYFVWDRTFHIRPVPGTIETIQIYAICNEQSLVAGSTVDIPERFHGALVNYVIKEMASKDLNAAWYDRYNARFEADKINIKASIRRQKRGDSFLIVKEESSLPYTTLGNK